MARATPILGLAIRLFAAAVWLFTGAAKVADLTYFEAQVGKYSLLPHALVAPFAYTLPFVELFVGAYLLIGLLTRAAAVLGCLLMVLFVIALSQAWARGLNIDCGCAGSVVHERVGFWAIARDVGLGLPGLVMALLPARLLSLDAALLGLPDRFRLPAPRWRGRAGAAPVAD